MANINIRVDSEIKQQASELFAELGMDMSTAVNVFLRQSINKNGLPFEVKARNDIFKQEEVDKAIYLSEKEFSESGISYDAKDVLDEFKGKYFG